VTARHRKGINSLIHWQIGRAPLRPSSHLDEVMCHINRPVFILIAITVFNCLVITVRINSLNYC
jgi:hypothetical protein